MLRRRLQRWIPKPEAVRANPSLRWLGPLLDRPWLWQPSRRRIAGGAAIGVFFAFAIPVAQILLAAGAAVLAIEAGRTILVDAPALEATALAAGISVVSCCDSDGVPMLDDAATHAA